ncbi:MAG: exodeoxyribonuclease VII small subunit [Solirubrobacterales bacterium]|nr:exodeoxyribonuclease VII small subunit [Solirubrobacterales bacterium]
MSDERSYESAVRRVEEILGRLDGGDAGLRETLSLVAEGRELVEYCAGELEDVSAGLQELRLDQLVTRLSDGAAHPGARPPDAGPPDARPPEARPPDAGPPEARPPDARPPDAGRP